MLPIGSHKQMFTELAQVYVEASADIKRVILKMLEQPVRQIGMSSAELLEFLENFPQGAETLVTRIVYLMTERSKSFFYCGWRHWVILRRRHVVLRRRWTVLRRHWAVLRRHWAKIDFGQKFVLFFFSETLLQRSAGVPGLVAHLSHALSRS